MQRCDQFLTLRFGAFMYILSSPFGLQIEAFKGLMAVQSLPMDGIQALKTAKNLSKTLLYSTRCEAV